jgi:hypothetical protein
MRACLLRAGLSRATRGTEFVLGNPKSWLGTAYHEVLERIAVAEPETVQLRVEELWNSAIKMLHQRAMAHRLDQRFGAPEAWPGYFLARAAVQLRADDLVAQARLAHVDPAATAYGQPTSFQEHELTAFEGKLVGRPDVVRGEELIDYKTGSISEYDEITQGEIVKASYIRQLRIYGFLVHEKLGIWPKRGFLLPLAGAGVEVPLEPVSCEREARETITLLDGYNARIKAGHEPEAFATPAEMTCKWCPFKVICPAFWKAASPAWAGQLDGTAIAGILDGPLRTIHGGAALAASIDVTSGTGTVTRADIAPLSHATHFMGARAVDGEVVRVVGLRTRVDGRLVPTIRTTFARLADIPTIRVS